MNKRIVSTVVSLTLAASALGGFAVTAQAAEAKTPQYQTNARQMEALNRGLIAVKTTADTREQTKNGVYLSWRLLGTESLENQAFDIYRNGTKIHTTGVHDATNYLDPSGKDGDKYKVVRAGEDASNEEETSVNPINNYAKPNEVGSGNSHKNSFSYIDIPIVRPDDVARMGDGKTSHYYTVDKDHQGGANDASVGDLDGDGDYEIVLKWDPTDSKDSAGADFTGNVYIDAYEIDENNGGYKWRIDLGQNVTAGAHYTQFMVYDFDGDGKAEVAMKTAPGSKDGNGEYVSKAGDTDEIRNVDNTKQFIGTSGRLKGKNPFTQYLTIFDGETGAALYTTEFIPYEAAEDKYWGDGGAKYNRSERYLAAVAYLDGVTPSLIMCRGYYHDSVIRAYNWDGSELTMLWEHVGKRSESNKTLYAQGNHNLSIGDIDNDGKDEIVYGSASLDDDGKTVLGNTGLGHGDAMHMNDFNNDGVQEVFSVKEEEFKTYAEDLRVASTGKHFWGSGKITTRSDNGRGVMDNIDDEYAKTHKNAMAIGWSSGLTAAHDLNGDDLKAKPSSAGNGSFDNSLVYWDGDLGRELLDANIIQKYDAANGWTKRFYGPSDGYTLTGGSTNNYTKRNASLSADLWGDWREEVILPVGKGQNETPALRIFTSTLPTDYRLTTLMHDSQYRLGIAWQNVAYNQPPHTSYYIGSAALATDESGNTLNYLAPAVPYTKVTYEAPAMVYVSDITLSDANIRVEKGKTATINASVVPENATKKGIIWTSSDTNVATVSNGIVKAVGEGTATITAATKGTAEDGTTTFSKTCEVEVFSTPVTGVKLSEKAISLGMNNSQTLTAEIIPDSASNKSLTWVSDNPAVAAVDSEGKVTGVSFGKTTVKAISDDSGIEAECIVKVKPIDIENAIGEDVFDFAEPNTDSQTTLDASANKASLIHNGSNNGAVVQRSFESYTENTATIEFRLTTGGQQNVGTGSDKWNWVGHEYSMGLKFLDTEGNNILNIYQPYKEKAKELMSVTGSGEPKSVTASGSGWNNSGNVAGNIQGSSKRWKVKAEFDYNSDTCTVTVTGTGSDWVTDDGVMKQTFPLNGASFKTLQLYTTKDGEGTIKASPNLDNLTYNKTKMVYGNTEDIYSKGAADAPWAAEDIDGWTQSGQETASLALDSENGRIWYNPTKPGAEYSAEKAFDGIESGAIVTYDVDWHFGLSTGRDTNIEYIQFGDKLKIGWTNGYRVWVSTDGGTSWIDSDNDGTPDSIFEGANQEYTKNVKAIFNTNSKIVTLYFDGVKIGDYTYSDLDSNTPDGADSVKFGFERGGAAADWAHPNGIDRIRVSQFTEGEEAPDVTELKILGMDENDTKTANLQYSLVDYEGDEITLIGVIYEWDSPVVNEVQIKKVQNPEKNTVVNDSITFENDPGTTVKVYMWDSEEGMVPICEPAEYEFIRGTGGLH